MRELADKYFLSRSTIFKRAAREHWKQNATLVEATRKQIVQKLEAKMEEGFQRFVEEGIKWEKKKAGFKK